MIVDEIYTVKETAKFLKLGVSTLYRLAERGELPVIRLGRSIRFRRSTLESFMDEQEGRLA